MNSRGRRYRPVIGSRVGAPLPQNSAREGKGVGPVAYSLRGRLGGLGLGGGEFESRGEIDLGSP